MKLIKVMTMMITTMKMTKRNYDDEIDGDDRDHEDGYDNDDDDDDADENNDDDYDLLLNNRWRWTKEGGAADGNGGDADE